jgi:hypothetical protein
VLRIRREEASPPPERPLGGAPQWPRPARAESVRAAHGRFIGVADRDRWRRGVDQSCLDGALTPAAQHVSSGFGVRGRGAPREVGGARPDGDQGRRGWGRRALEHPRELTDAPRRDVQRLRVGGVRVDRCVGGREASSYSLRSHKTAARVTTTYGSSPSGSPRACSSRWRAGLKLALIALCGGKSHQRGPCRPHLCRTAEIADGRLRCACVKSADAKVKGSLVAEVLGLRLRRVHTYMNSRGPDRSRSGGGAVSDATVAAA